MDPDLTFHRIWTVIPIVVELAKSSLGGRFWYSAEGGEGSSIGRILDDDMIIYHLGMHRYSRGDDIDKSLEMDAVDVWLGVNSMAVSLSTQQLVGLFGVRTPSFARNKDVKIREQQPLRYRAEKGPQKTNVIQNQWGIVRTPKNDYLQ